MDKMFYCFQKVDVIDLLKLFDDQWSLSIDIHNYKSLIPIDNNFNAAFDLLFF